MTSNNDANTLYWRGLHEWHLSEVAVPCDKSKLRNKLKDESFRPDPKNGNAISMCVADTIPTEDFLSHIQSYQDKSDPEKHKQYVAIATLSRDELKENGFTFDQDDVPYKGHVNVIHKNYINLPKEKRQLLRDTLKKLAIDRGIRFFECKNGKFYEVQANY